MFSRVWVLAFLLGFAGPLTAIPANYAEPAAASSARSSASSSHFAIYNLELLSHLPLASMGGASSGNDIWGWTDSGSNREFAVVGLRNGTAFVEITNPASPVYVGFLPTHTNDSLWRDVKVYSNHAYVVSENNPGHGMQVFDLTQLLSVASPPVTFSNTAHYAGFGDSHNIVINEDTGFAYSVGDDSGFGGGLHFIDITTPASPVAAGGFSGSGYVHDAQVVTYNGPDSAYVGSEIAFCSVGVQATGASSLKIVDVSNKASPVVLSSGGYAASEYIHQGWLTEDHAYFLTNDELDERKAGNGISFTRTHVWNVSDLNNVIYVGYYEGPVTSIDHNLYIHNGLIYEANYTTGLRVLDIVNLATPDLTEIAYIDTHPSKDSTVAFQGAWSVYPFFPSGTIAIGDIEEGLILVRLLSADASITSTVSTDPITQGYNFDYQLVASSSGPDPTSNTTVIATLPAGVAYVSSAASQGSCSESAGVVTCLLGAIASGSNATADITVTAGTVGTPTINASIAADEPDPNAGNENTSVGTTVLMDTDGDGLSDVFEISIGSNPNLVDSDGDTISDFDEVNYDGNSAAYTIGQDTNPNSADTDSDTINDNLDAFPLDPAESIDTDSDGIGNNADPDDDNDGFSDLDEIAAGTDPLDENSFPPPAPAPLLGMPALIALLILFFAFGFRRVSKPQ